MSTARILEAQQVKDFLASSAEFKEMRRIALLCPQQTCYEDDGNGGTIATKRFFHRDIINIISDTKTFSDLVIITEAANIAGSKDATTRFFGQTGMTAAAYVGSFFSNGMNFVYYFMKFREKTIEKIAQLGVRIETPELSL